MVRHGEHTFAGGHNAIVGIHPADADNFKIFYLNVPRAAAASWLPS